MLRLTKDEFLDKYHEYRTSSRDEARREVSQVMVRDDHAVVIEIAGEYCLMLMSAAVYAAATGVEGLKAAGMGPDWKEETHA